MRKRIAPVALTAALLALSVCAAYALWVEYRLMPKSLDHLDRTFTIVVKDREQWKEFFVTVEAKPKSRPLSPFTDADLTLLDRGEYVAQTPLAEKREKGKVTYRFRVTPSALERSRFEFSEGNYVPGSEEIGAAPADRPRVERIMGGASYWFRLTDFAR